MAETEKMDMAMTTTAVRRPSAAAQGMRSREGQRDERTLEKLIQELREGNSMAARDSAAKTLRQRLKVAVQGKVSETFQNLTACDLEDVVQEAFIELLAEVRNWDWVTEEAGQGSTVLSLLAKRMISRIMERHTGRIRPSVPGDPESQKEAKARRTEVTRQLIGTSLDGGATADESVKEIAASRETDATLSWLSRESVRQLLVQWVGPDSAELVLRHYGEGHKVVDLARAESLEGGEPEVKVAGKLRGRLHRAVKTLKVPAFEADLRELVAIGQIRA